MGPLSKVFGESRRSVPAGEQIFLPGGGRRGGFVTETLRLTLADTALALALLRGIGDRSEEAMPALVAPRRGRRAPTSRPRT